MAFIGDGGGGGGGGYRNIFRRHARRAFHPPIGGGGGQPAPPGPPGTPPPPTGSQIPGQGIYLQKQALAENAYQQALAQIAQRKSQTFRDYGFLENGQVDPNATHGQLQDLWRGQAANADQEDLSMLGRGISGGLAGQAMHARKVLEGGQNLQLQNNYTNAMQELANQRTGAENEHSAALLQAQQEALQEALQAQNFTPAQAPGEDPEEAPAPPSNLPGRARARQHLARAAARRVGRHRGRRH